MGVEWLQHWQVPEDPESEGENIFWWEGNHCNRSEILSILFHFLPADLYRNDKVFITKHCNIRSQFMAQKGVAKLNRFRIFVRTT